MTRPALCLCAMLLLAPALLAAAPDDALLYLPFDGSAEAKVSGGDPKARVEGAPAYVEGVQGKAVVVGGKERILYRAAGSFDPKRGSCTLWAAPQDWTAGVDTFQFLASFLNAQTNVDYLLYKVCDQPVLSFLARDADRASRVLTKGILSWRPGQWHRVAATWDEKGYRLFIDGRQVAEGSAVALPAEGWGQIVIGTPYPSWGRLGEHKTVVDEVRVYARALAPEEVARQYREETAASPLLQKALAEEKATDTQRRSSNLALSANGAVILTSSFADTRASYSDNAIDGDGDTAWRSFDAAMPQWLEIRWEYPMAATAVAFDEVAPSRTTAFSVQAWDGRGAWRLVKRVAPAAADHAGHVACEFPEVRTDRLRLVVEANSGPHTQYTEVAVFGPPQPNAGALRPFWKGYHVWYPEPDEQVHAEPRCFRATFEIPAGERLESAFLQLYTNDLYSVFLNGEPAAKGFKMMDPLSVAKHLRPGRNCLAIVATPTSQPGWPNMCLTADLTINTDRQTRVVTTDASMKVSREAPAGWDQPGFDDGAWQPPLLVARVGHGIWGRLAYADRAARERIQVEKVELPEGKLKPGDTATVRVHLRPSRVLPADYVFAFTAGDEPVLGGQGDYTVCRGTVTPPVPSSQWPTDRATVVEIPVTLPAYAPDGEVPLRVEGLNTGSGRGLDLVDGNGKRLAAIGSLHVDRFGGEAAASQQRAGTKDGPSAVAAGGSPGVKARVTREAPALAFELDGKPTVPLIWAYENPTFEKIHLSAGTGVHLYQARGYPLRPDGTPEGLQRLCRLLDQHITSILRVDRDARVIVMLDLRPSQTWLAQHPEARLVTAFGKQGPQSYFSKAHETLVGDHLRSIIRYIQSRPYAGHVFSYDICTCGTPDSALGGNDENLFQRERAKLTMGDYHPEAVAALREWLKAKYGGRVAGLRAAWRDPNVTFETARVENSLLIREGAGGGVFRDPAAGAAAPDTYQFLSGGMLRFIQKLAALVKQETGGRALTGNYYGYDVAALRGYNLVGSVLQNNNFELDAAMKSDLFDYYAMVPSYNHRLAGSHFEPQHSMASMDLHRRLYLAELDTRTFTAAATQWGRQRTARESVEVMKRDLAEKILHGHAAWFADWAGHGLREVGYFVDPDLLSAIARSREIYQQNLNTPRPGVAQIAVFVSGKAWFHHDLYTAPPIYHNLIARTLFQQLAHIGAPYDVLRLEDAGNPKVRKQYKLCVFLNAFALDEADQKALDALKRDGKTLLWFYAPGYVRPGQGLDVDGIRRATGITAVVKPGKEVMECRILAGSHPMVAGLPGGTVERVAPYHEAISDVLHPAAFAPIFVVSDPGAVTLGAYPDGRPALAVRDFGTWKSVYSAVPTMDASLLRGVAQDAGVHLFCAPGPVVMAHGPFLALHKGFDAPAALSVELPAPYTVTDLYAGQVVARGVSRFELSAPGCATWLLQLSR